VTHGIDRDRQREELSLLAFELRYPDFWRACWFPRRDPGGLRRVVAQPTQNRIKARITPSLYPVLAEASRLLVGSRSASYERSRALRGRPS
jgi:hypothetical protein